MLTRENLLYVNSYERSTPLAQLLLGGRSFLTFSLINTSKRVIKKAKGNSVNHLLLVCLHKNRSITSLEKCLIIPPITSLKKFVIVPPNDNEMRKSKWIEQQFKGMLLIKNHVQDLYKSQKTFKWAAPMRHSNEFLMGCWYLVYLWNRIYIYVLHLFS